MIGENIAFYPVNAIQIRNAHNYLSDFESERDVYLKTEKIVEFLDQWDCSHEDISECAVLLAEEFSKRDFWGVADAKLVRDWIFDLRSIGYQFPPRTNETDYFIMEQVRGANCRRADVEFDTEKEDTMIEKSAEKLRMFGELTDWCAKANFSDFLRKLPSPPQLATSHAKNQVLVNLQKSVSLYSIFAFGVNMLTNYETGAEKYDDSNGYYVMADDSTFNFWHGINPFLVMHPSGDLHRNSGVWWKEPVGTK
ncbi:hypothetical protein ANCCEY_02495 [Ancylostoma ceylanicum]|uniref:Uncharacterized protein n=1 Tax=Ancylostoma ceylanicum TaxID=53326 RepID=A0A0D6M2U0_9BILA|nr:hypothetical protein ANCCEY_02495 [Ancylostoma ceylanicum]